MEKAHVYILTIGVAPSWFSRRDGQFVFAPDLRNIKDYVQRTATVNEATEALLQVIKDIHEINPTVQIVLTLSPVPLEAHSSFPCDRCRLPFEISLARGDP